MSAPMATPLPSRPMSVVALLALGVVCLMPRPSEGHGYLYEPPGRSSMWRQGYGASDGVKSNTDDMGINCGGFNTQWNTNGGKCGVCGDSYSDATPRANEVGGKYANATSRPIVGKYTQGQSVEFKVHITAYHKGWIGFKLCPTNNFGIEATQDCLDQHPLATADGTTEYTLQSAGYSGAWYNVTFTLPADMTCDLCVLQWQYHTGNNWGNDPGSTSGCVGCGPQEEFYACADVSIGASGNDPATSAPATKAPATNAPATNAPATNPPATNAPATNAPATNVPATNAPATNAPVTIDPANSCRGKAPFYNTPSMDTFCERNCKAPEPFCPPTHCECGGAPATTAAPLVCFAVGAFEGDASITRWCNNNCNYATPYCPATMCACV